MGATSRIICQGLEKSQVRSEEGEEGGREEGRSEGGRGDIHTITCTVMY